MDSIDLAPLVIYKRFRKDGWPLCPSCGENGLIALMPTEVVRGIEVPKRAVRADYVARIRECKLCGWRPEKSEDPAL